MDPITKLIHAQPFRAIYVFSRVALLLVRLPYWTLLHMLGVGRPRPSWTLKKTLLVKSLREMAGSAMRTGKFRGRDHTIEVLAKHCQDARFIWVDKVSPHFIVGEIQKLAESCGAEPVRIPAYGFGNWGSGSEVPLARDGEKVFMHLHGGAYVMGTAHPEDMTANIPRGLVQYGRSIATRVLSIDYRLCASDPYPIAAPFPTSLLDALSGYVYLTRALGFKPQNVIISGDSAGGNLAHAIVRYLRDNPELGLGLPGAMVLFSPWSDPGGTHQGLPGGQAAHNLNSDYLKAQTSPTQMGPYAVRSLLGSISVQEARKNPYISPASLDMEPTQVSGMFTAFPPSYLVSGGGEVLIDEIRTLSQRMKEDLQDKFTYDEVADAAHDFVAFPLWEPERGNTLKNIVNWTQQL